MLLQRVLLDIARQSPLGEIRLPQHISTEPEVERSIPLREALFILCCYHRSGAANAFAELAAAGVPAKAVLALAEHVVRGRIAQAGGEHAEAVRQFEAAVAIEDGLAYTEPPYWYYPTRQSLGAALLLAGDAERAEVVLRSSLARSPNNGWALFGLMKAYERRGDRAGVRVAGRLLEQAWMGKDELLELGRL